MTKEKCEQEMQDLSYKMQKLALHVAESTPDSRIRSLVENALYTIDSLEHTTADLDIIDVYISMQGDKRFSNTFYDALIQLVICIDAYNIKRGLES